MGVLRKRFEKSSWETTVEAWNEMVSKRRGEADFMMTCTMMGEDVVIFWKAVFVATVRSWD